mmetsp:Transcript_46670/g.89137  ORF Transcript_46670/g.89137 Transcript_46670/m.89137 type:complete len:241 (+) Transcript_46670:408-1130(+)
MVARGTEFADALRRNQQAQALAWHQQQYQQQQQQQHYDARRAPASHGYHQQLPQSHYRPQQDGPNVAARWVETGAAVGNLYQDVRADARDHARLRNVFFQQATQAYQVGNKALAKDLAFKGRYHAEQMKAAHAHASEAIFAQRNGVSPMAMHPSSGGGNQPLLIDLHGLHVAEALAFLRQRVGEWRAYGQRVHVHLLVGTGHHTRGTRTPARLPAVVEDFLRSESLRYSEPQPGLLDVHI